jgi:hypothetical protein
MDKEIRMVAGESVTVMVLNLREYHWSFEE